MTELQMEELLGRVKSLMDARFEAFEDRLAAQLTKAFDVVLADYERRLRAIEEDVAKLMRHTGME